MLEQDIRETYRRMAGTVMPPSQLSIPAADRARRTRQRRRRASLIAAPILAAAAVLAIALSGVALSGNSTPPGAPARPTVAPAHFSPTRPYAWIAGLQKDEAYPAQVNLSRTYESITYNTSPSETIDLRVDSAGQCHVQAGQLACPGQFAGSRIATYRLGHVVGKLAGFPAYWKVTAHPESGSPSILSWQYARGGWAQVSAGTLRDSLRLAGRVSFGTGAAPEVTFPVQLRSMPAGWQVNSVAAVLWHGQLPAAAGFGAAPEPLDQAVLSPYGLSRTPYLSFWVNMGPGCRPDVTRVINGRTVHLGNLVRGVPQSLCTAYSGGPFSYATFGYIVNADPRMGGAAKLFAQHLHVLGPNPADWTTRLIG